jgi:hypothetical protein
MGILFTFITLIVLVFFVVIFLLIFGCIQAGERPVQSYSYVPDRHYDNDLSEEIYSMNGNRKKFG